MGGCRCPGVPHTDGDWVEFPDALSPAMGAEGIYALQAVIRGVMAEGGTVQQATAASEGALAEIWLRHISDWSFIEADGPVPITTANVHRLLPWNDGGAEAVEFADSLYSEDLTGPLVRRQARSSQAGPSTPSTSPSRSSGPAPRKPSKRSSPTATAGRK